MAIPRTRTTIRKAARNDAATNEVTDVVAKLPKGIDPAFGMPVGRVGI